MRLVCETCGTVFSVTVHCGPEDSRLDWTNEPHHCFVCGGQAMEKDENNERESQGAGSVAETQSRVEEVLGMAQSHLDDWETGLREGLYDDESGYKDARADLEAVREMIEAVPEAIEACSQAEGLLARYVHQGEDEIPMHCAREAWRSLDNLLRKVGRA